MSDYCGYLEEVSGVLARREYHGGVVLILNLGGPFGVGPADAAKQCDFGSFLAGVQEAAVRTQFVDSSHGIQVNLTPLGAHRMFGVPMHELANQVVELDSLAGTQLGELAEQLDGEDDWSTRFAILDQFLTGWSSEGPDPDAAVLWAWNQIRRSHGQVSVTGLAEEIGWSRRHFADRFRRQIGLAPKAMARVLRFQHASQMLLEHDARSITDVAATCGFSDHSHLVRDFQSLAGCTPSQYRAAQVPGGVGIAD